MARKKRIWFPGARYHITSRGIRRSALFYDEKDRLSYLRILAETKSRMPFVLDTYCLMTNHVHLQMETFDHPPGDIIKLLHSKYAKYFNQKYDFTGHVFEGRFKAELLDTFDYELTVNKYIHLNPIRAKMVENLIEYKWSSYSGYVSGKKNPLISTDRVMAFFPEPKVNNYLQFLRAAESVDKEGNEGMDDDGDGACHHENY